MEYFAGLDVATEETAICVIDGAGSIVLEATVATDPETIWRALREHLPRLRRVGHEAGSLSPWLQAELTKLGLPAVPRSFQRAEEHGRVHGASGPGSASVDPSDRV